MPRMTHYRCVGGPLDGQFVELSAGVKFLHTPIPSAKGGARFEYSVRELIVAARGVLSYLAPSDWDDVKALRHLFELDPHNVSGVTDTGSGSFSEDWMSAQIAKVANAATAIWLNPPKRRPATDAEVRYIAKAFGVPVSKVRPK